MTFSGGGVGGSAGGSAAQLKESVSAKKRNPSLPEAARQPVSQPASELGGRQMGADDIDAVGRLAQIGSARWLSQAANNAPARERNASERRPLLTQPETIQSASQAA